MDKFEKVYNIYGTTALCPTSYTNINSQMISFNITNVMNSQKIRLIFKIIIIAEYILLLSLCDYFMTRSRKKFLSFNMLCMNELPGEISVGEQNVSNNGGNRVMNWKDSQLITVSRIMWWNHVYHIFLQWPHGLRYFTYSPGWQGIVDIDCNIVCLHCCYGYTG